MMFFKMGQLRPPSVDVTISFWLINGQNQHKSIIIHYQHMTNTH